MVSSIYFSNDVFRATKACVLLAIKESVAHGATNIEYIRGMIDFAHTQVVLCGFTWEEFVTELRSECSARTLELLECSLSLQDGA